MSVTDTLKLNNGVEIPIIANGSYAPPEKRDAVTDWTLTAIQAGYRHIDTAYIYGTEHAVGRAIKASSLPRSEIFITTKLPWHHHSRVHESINESLANLDLEYVDLYLMHWPQCVKYDESNDLPLNPDGTLACVSTPTFVEIWADMEEVLKQGKARAIGVSNFSIKNLEILLAKAKIIPAINQVELHPYLAQNDLREYCKSKGIVLMAYTPSGYDVVRKDPTILSLATKYNCTANQVILAWHLTRETVIVPKSENAERQKENLTLPKLDESDIAAINKLDRGQRICNKPDPEHGKVWGWTMEQLGW